MRVKADKTGNNENGSQGDRLLVCRYYALIICADACFGLGYLCFNLGFRPS